MIENNYVENGISLANITRDIFSKVIEYCKKHGVVVLNGDGGSTEEELKEWDTNFMNDIDQSTLFMAANYLNIQNLLTLTCLSVADMIKCRTP
ncbi:unnamed protein product [Microthlaspi erraticum]|uniref:SKP1 component POZ domain-containing protein n=1 Tax=Microthlaspi erraticum TaxID=1685480 RepID=A0A6D2KPR9_9BRAS|nr:unnamed protein product [Microthlaspi erraticum]CAA7053983.1 unnamed protein product [Microthlaspi erraticum]